MFSFSFYARAMVPGVLIFVLWAVLVCALQARLCLLAGMAGTAWCTVQATAHLATIVAEFFFRKLQLLVCVWCLWCACVLVQDWVWRFCYSCTSACTTARFAFKYRYILYSQGDKSVFPCSVPAAVYFCQLPLRIRVEGVQQYTSVSCPSGSGWRVCSSILLSAASIHWMHRMRCCCDSRTVKGVMASTAVRLVGQLDVCAQAQSLVL
jgi:hypothetical protein